MQTTSLSFFVVASLCASSVGCSSTEVVAGAAVTDAGAAVVVDAPDSGVAPAPAPTVVEGEKGPMFGAETKLFAKVDAQGKVVSFGLTVPVAGFEKAPKSVVAEELTLVFPKVVYEQTLVNHYRVGWYPQGHGPKPYTEGHFDLHFYRDPVREIDWIDCIDKRALPKDVLPPGYKKPELCVSHMGYHSWPLVDLEPNAKYTGSMIIGSYAERIIFFEPMITKKLFLERATFELEIPKPASPGGDAMGKLYPTHFVSAYVAESDSYSMEFDRLEGF